MRHQDPQCRDARIDAQELEGERESVLVYDEPVNEYEYRLNAAPLGNGRIGCMFTGGAARDLILLNHEELRRRMFREAAGKSSRGLAEVRDLCLSGKWDEGARVLAGMAEDVGCKRDLNPFHPVGDLILEMDLESYSENYRRTLDLESGIGRVTFSVEGTLFEKTYFVSAPHNLLVINICADKPQSIFAEIALGRKPVEGCTLSGFSEGEELYLTGNYREGVSFAAQTKVRPSGGKISVEKPYYEGPGVGRDNYADKLVSARVCGADEVTVLTSLSVSFSPGKRRAHEKINWENVPDFNTIYRIHVKDHHKLFERVSIHLGEGSGKGENSPKEEQTIESLIHQAYLGKPGSRLIELVFQMGRYLLMASSRPGTLAANLQGIWNHTYLPPWQARYQLDFNLQANYWPAHPVNLEECISPLFDLIESLVPSAEEFARDFYGLRGILLGVGTDGQNIRYGSNYETPCIAGWLAAHYWDHYLFTMDRAFLEQRAYPFMRKVGTFFEDFLFRGKDGRYVILPSNSPENTPSNRNVRLAKNSTFDIAVVKEVFTNLLSASRIIERDQEKHEVWQEIVDNLPDWPIGNDGSLLEWADPSAEPNHHHRHLSHLYPLFPGTEFTMEETPELVSAALKSLELRERAFRKDACSFSYIWPAFHYARAGMGEEALKRLCLYLKGFLMPNLLSSMGDWRQQGLARRRSSKLASHIFQIESGLAATALIAEMLLQSHGGCIRVLPALPDSWDAGEVNGLRARGGFEISIAWQAKRIQRLRLQSRSVAECRLRLCQKAATEIAVRSREKRVPFIREEDDLIRFNVQPGIWYSLV